MKRGKLKDGILKIPSAIHILSFILFGLHNAFTKTEAGASLPVPPLPISSQCEVFVDKPKTITLQTTGRIKEPLKFIIRKKPLKGTLGGIQPSGAQSADVEYTPLPGAEPGEDYFTYAAKSVDSGVSAPANFTIKLVKRPSVLEFPKHLNFGIVPLGDSNRIDFILSNSGGQDAVLDMSLNFPWRFAEPPPTRLAGGERAVVGLIFEPKSVGNFSHSLFLKAGSSNIVVLQGACTEALEWPSQGFVITPELRGRDDLSIPFRNRTMASRTIEFEWPEFIVAPKKISIPANGNASVSLVLDPATPPFYSSKNEVRFRSGNSTDSFLLIIQPTPAQLEFCPPDIIDFGKARVSETASSSFVVSNLGGRSCELHFETPSEISVRPNPEGIMIAPGKSEEFEFFYRPDHPGHFRLLIKVGLKGGPLRDIAIQGVATSSESTDKILNLPRPQPVIRPSPVAAIPVVEELIMNESSANSITIKWKIPSPETANFVIERQEIIAGANGRSQAAWNRWDGVQVEVSTTTASAHFRKLAPNSFWKIRIIGVDAKGLLGPPPKKNFRISTKAVNLWKIPFWIWMPSALAMLMGVWYFIPKKINKNSNSQ
jgi:hypothetical protein